MKFYDGVFCFLKFLDKVLWNSDKSLVVILDGKDEGSKVDFFVCFNVVEIVGVQVYGIVFLKVEVRFVGSLKVLSWVAFGSYSEVCELDGLFQVSERVFQVVVFGLGMGAFFVFYIMGVKILMVNKWDYDWFIGMFMDEGEGVRELLFFYVGVKFDFMGEYVMKQVIWFEFV